MEREEDLLLTIASLGYNCLTNCYSFLALCFCKNLDIGKAMFATENRFFASARTTFFLICSSVFYLVNDSSVFLKLIFALKGKVHNEKRRNTDTYIHLKKSFFLRGGN